MDSTIEFLRLFINNHSSYEYSIIFLSALFGGELALFALGFLAAQGVLSIYPAILFSFIGALIPNILWFLIGKTKTISNLFFHRYASPTVSAVTEGITTMSKGSHFIALTIIKFIVGTPFILITYVHKTGINFKKFLYFESGSILLSLLIIMPLGFLSGLGFNYIMQIFDSLYAALGFLLLTLLAIIVVKLLIKQSLTKNNSL